MGLTAYHRPSPPRSLGASRPLPVPAIAAFYAAGGHDQVDALVLNDLAARLLAQLAGSAAAGCEVELLHDPQNGELGITPWVMGRPLTTLHRVHPTRFRGSGPADEYAAAVRAAWPVKVEAPQFMGCWQVPVISLARPAAVEVRGGALIFHPERLVLTR